MRENSFLPALQRLILDLQRLFCSKEHGRIINFFPLKKQFLSKGIGCSKWDSLPPVIEHLSLYGGLFSIYIVFYAKMPLSPYRMLWLPRALAVCEVKSAYHLPKTVDISQHSHLTQERYGNQTSSLRRELPVTTPTSKF